MVWAERQAKAEPPNTEAAIQYELRAREDLRDVFDLRPGMEAVMSTLQPLASFPDGGISFSPLLFEWTVTPIHERGADTAPKVLQLATEREPLRPRSTVLVQWEHASDRFY